MLTSASQYIFGKEKKRTLMVGLENSGKTTILYNLKLGEVITSIPSVDFNVETMKYKTNTIISWDIQDQDKQRTLWRPYFHNTSYLIFVVDSSDREHITKARDELQQLLSETELKNAHLLVYANKKDLSNAMIVAEITNKLGLHSLNNRRWHVEDICATSSDGLFEGLNWLTKRSETVK